MKKILWLLLFGVLAVTPAFSFSTQFEIGESDSFTLGLPLNDSLSLNAGLKYHKVNFVLEKEYCDLEVDATGSVFLPTFGLEYKLYQTDHLSMSFGTNLMFVLPTFELSYSDDSDDEGNETEEYIQDKADDILKNFSSMALDVYTKVNYNVTEEFGLFGKFGYKSLGATYDPNDEKYGLGIAALYTTVGLQFNFM